MKIASMLLEIGAIKLSPHKPFTWASGWKSPIYCDNRLSLSYPDVRLFIKNAIVDVLNEKYTLLESVAGVATAGIPQGCLVADAMNLPFLYVRPKPKDHGMENLIEGKVTPGQKVVLIEDLISTGGSSLKAAEALKAGGFQVLGMISIFSYGFAVADQNFGKAGIELISLCNYNILLDEALKGGYIESDQLPLLKAWREDPAGWGREKVPDKL
jgi:orotate phosphoribosyltransferase